MIKIDEMERDHINSNEWNIVVDTVLEWQSGLKDNDQNSFLLTSPLRDESLKKRIREILLKNLEDQSSTKRKGYVQRNMEKLLEKTFDLADILVQLNFHTRQLTENLLVELENARTRIDLHMMAHLISEDSAYFFNSLRTIPYPVDESEKELLQYLSKEQVISMDKTDFLIAPAKEAFYREGYSPIPAGDELRLIRPLLQEVYESSVCADEQLPELVSDLMSHFRSEKDFETYIDGKDFSFGIANVKDEVFLKRLEKVQTFLRELVDEATIEAGQYLRLEDFPVSFMRSIPIVDGKWIDLEVASMIEFYETILAGEYRIEDSPDPHLFAFPMIIRSENNQPADYQALEELMDDARSTVNQLFWDKRIIRGREHLKFHRYRDIREKDGLDLSLHRGFKTASLNGWVDTVIEGRDELIEGIEPFYTGLSAQNGPLVVEAEEKIINHRLQRSERAERTKSWILHTPPDCEDIADGLEDGVLARPYRGHTEPARKILSEVRKSLVNIYRDVHALQEAGTNISSRLFNSRDIIREDTAQNQESILVKIEEIIDDFNAITAAHLDNAIPSALGGLNDRRGKYSWGNLFPEGFEIIAYTSMKDVYARGCEFEDLFLGSTEN